MKLLAREDHCSATILQQLGRTPTMRVRMKKVGFIPSPPAPKHAFGQLRPTGLEKCSPSLGSRFLSRSRPFHATWRSEVGVAVDARFSLIAQRCLIASGQNPSRRLQRSGRCRIAAWRKHAPVSRFRCRLALGQTPARSTPTPAAPSRTESRRRRSNWDSPAAINAPNSGRRDCEQSGRLGTELPSDRQPAESRFRAADEFRRFDASRKNRDALGPSVSILRLIPGLRTMNS